AARPDRRGPGARARRRPTRGCRPSRRRPPTGAPAQPWLTSRPRRARRQDRRRSRTPLHPSRDTVGSPADAPRGASLLRSNLGCVVGPAERRRDTPRGASADKEHSLPCGEWPEIGPGRRDAALAPECWLTVSTPPPKTRRGLGLDPGPLFLGRIKISF